MKITGPIAERLHHCATRDDIATEGVIAKALWKASAPKLLKQIEEDQEARKSAAVILGLQPGKKPEPLSEAAF